MDVLPLVGVIVGAVASSLGGWLARKADFARERKHRRADQLLEAYVAWIEAIQQRAQDHSGGGQTIGLKSAQLESLRLRLDLLETDPLVLRVLDEIQQLLPKFAPGMNVFAAWNDFNAGIKTLKEYLATRHKA